MTTDTFTVDQLAAILAALTPPVADAGPPAEGLAASLVGKRVLVRTSVSGVSIGVLTACDVSTCTAVLRDAVRVWSWEDAFTVSELATVGGKCRVANHPDGIVISDTGFELVPVADAAWADIRDRWSVGRK